MPAALARRPRVSVGLAPFLGRIQQLSAAGAEEVKTSWAQVFRTGDFYDPRYGDFSITRKDLARMAENFKSGKYPVAPTRLCVDYTHGTSRPASPEQGKAAGWILDLDLREDGDELWAQVEWTTEAVAFIEKKEYQFTSGTFDFEYRNSNGGEDLGATLHAFAICNRPVIHGMAPLSLAQAGAREIAASAFSYDETKRRVWTALCTAFGSRDSYGCVNLYLVELYDDGRAIYSDYDGNKFQVRFAIADDGVVAFTNRPVEVHADWTPLTPAGEEQTMSTMKVKDTKGQEIELAQEAIDAIVKAHASKTPAATPVELAALNSTLEKQAATIVELSSRAEKATTELSASTARVAALELAAKTAKAETAVDTLVTAGKVDSKDRQTWLDLALENEPMFTKLSATLPVKRELNTVTGSGGEAPTTQSAALDLAIADEQKANPKLTREQAYAAALDKHPTLYGEQVQ